MDKIGWKYISNPSDPTDVVPEQCCPNCKGLLDYFSGLETLPEHLFCPVCMDVAYSPLTGESIGRFDSGNYEACS